MGSKLERKTELCPLSLDGRNKEVIKEIDDLFKTKERTRKWAEEKV